MNKPVLIHPKPYQFESLANYIVRIKNENYLNMDWINDRLNLPKSKYLRQFNLINKEETLKEICALTGLSKESLEDMIINKYFYLSTLKKTKFDHHYFYRYIADSKFSKYCPLCLKENQYHKIYWHLKKVRICLKHEVFLVKACSTCGNTIKIRNIVEGRCDCGQSLINEDIMKCNNDKLIRSQNRLYGIYGIHLKNREIKNNRIGLDEIQLENLQNLFESLITKNMNFFLKHKLLCSTEQENILASLEYIEHIYENWPKELFLILDIMNKNYSDIGKLRNDCMLDEYIDRREYNEICNPLFVLEFTFPYSGLVDGLEKADYMNYELIHYFIANYNTEFFVNRIEDMNEIMKINRDFNRFYNLIKRSFGIDYEAVISMINAENNIQPDFREKHMYSILEKIVKSFFDIIRSAKKVDIKIKTNVDYISLYNLYELFKELYISFDDIISIINKEKIDVAIHPLKNGAYMIYLPRDQMKKKLLCLAASRI